MAPTSGNPNFGQPGAIVSSADSAIGLNGFDSGDYVEIPDVDGAPFSQPTSGAGLTVEVWMRPDALVFPGQTDQPYIHWLGKGDRSQFEWGLRFYSQDAVQRPNRISAYIWNPGGGEGAGAYFEDPNLQPGAWMHIVCVLRPRRLDYRSSRRCEHLPQRRAAARAALQWNALQHVPHLSGARLCSGPLRSA